MDEWIGDTAYKLSIAFFDPRILNFTLEDTITGTETLIMGFVNLFQYSEEDPTSTAREGPGGTDVILAHQIRKKPDGSGMGECPHRETPRTFRFSSTTQSPRC